MIRVVFEKVPAVWYCLVAMLLPVVGLYYHFDQILIELRVDQHRLRIELVESKLNTVNAKIRLHSANQPQSTNPQIAAAEPVPVEPVQPTVRQILLNRLYQQRQELTTELEQLQADKY
jgi:hypothetical protein